MIKTKTITLTTLRIEAIKDQFAYALKIIGGLSDIRLRLFLKEIEAKNIAEISFHGLKQNTYKSGEDIFFTVDWNKHMKLMSEGKQYVKKEELDNGVAVETNLECYFFKDNCKKKGLNIEMRVRYSDNINNNQEAKEKIQLKLGLRTARPDEQIQYSDSAYQTKKNVHAVEEVTITRRSE